jgi:hypothetical protein
VDGRLLEPKPPLDVEKAIRRMALTYAIPVAIWTILAGLVMIWWRGR